MRIERHIENRRGPPRGGRLRSGFKSFPRGATRFVEMHVGVNHSWKNGQLCRVDLLLSGTGQIRSEGDYFAVGDADVRVTTDDNIEIAHERRMTNELINDESPAVISTFLRH